MSDIETKISNFNNWGQPWTFHTFVCSDQSISLKSIELFNEIWIKASDFELWHNDDLILGCRASHKFILDNYSLTDETIAKIVRAISYEWA